MAPPSFDLDDVPLEVTAMISALEIGFALSASLLALAYVVLQPKPKPARIRARRPGSRRGSNV